MTLEQQTQTETQDQTAKQRPAKRWWRILAFTGLGIAGLVAIAITWLVSVDHQHLRDDAESLLSEVLGRDVAIDGELHLLLGRNIELSASKLRLSATDWSDQDDLLQLENLSATVDSRSLLSDVIVIESLTIDGLNVFLQENADGQNNWTFASTDSAIAQDESNERPSIPVKIHALSISDSTINLSLALPETHLVMQIDSLSETIQTDRSVAIGLAGTLNGTPLDIATSVNNVDNLNALRDVIIDVDASLGEVRLTSNMTIEDLLNPAQPRASVTLTGPNAEYLTNIMQWEQITTGPLSLALEIAPDDAHMSFDLDGNFGEFAIASTGIFDDLQVLQNAAFDFSASGPNAGRVASLFGIDGIPAEAFEAKGSLQASGSTVDLTDARLSIGNTVLDANAHFADFPGVEGATAAAQLRGDAIEEFSQLTGLPNDVTGAFSADLTLNALADGTADMELTASSADTELRAKGNITDNAGLSDTRVDLQFSTPNLARLSELAGVSGLPPLPLNIQAALNRRETVTLVSSARIDVGGDFLLLSGTVGDDPLHADTTLDFELQLVDAIKTLEQLDIDASEVVTAPLNAKGQISAIDSVLSISNLRAHYVDAEVSVDGTVAGIGEVATGELRISSSGPNLANLLSATDRDLSTTFDTSMDLIASADSIEINDIDIRFDRTSFSGDLKFDRLAPLSNYSAAIKGTSSDLAALASAFADVDAPAGVPMTFDLQGNGQGAALQLDALTLEIGDAVLHAAGNITESSNFSGSKLQMDLDVPDLGYVAGIVGSSLPNESLQLSMQFESIGEDLVADNLMLKLGQNVVNGTVSLRREEVPYVKVDLSSEVLDLSPYVDDVPPAEPETESTKDNGETRLIPDTPVAIEILDKLNADIAVSVKKLVIHEREQTDLQVTASVNDGGLHVDTFKLTGEYGGNLWGRLGVQPVAAGVEFGMRLFGENIEIGLPAESEEEQRALPRYDLKLAFITRGKTVREMAGAVNGYVKVVGGAGVLRTGMMDVFTQDFLFELLETINPFLKNDPYTKLKCMAILATVEDGQLAGNPVLVAQSERLKVVARTRINLKTETVDADINTVAQKGLGISLNDLINPYVKVGGTLKSPALRFDQNSALIEGGAAVATAGISILAKNLAGRFLGASDPCKQAITDAEVQFEKLEKQYGSGPSGTGMNQ